MEPPTAFEANRVRDEKLKVLEAIVPPSVEAVGSMSVRAQYGPGVIGRVRVPGYRLEGGVAPDSRTETYAALRLHVSNWRWAGVPFYLRTGKRLARRLTEIAVTLKPVPHMVFQSKGSIGVQPKPDRLHRPTRRRGIGLAWGQDPGAASVRSTWSSATGLHSCRSPRRRTSD